jgi:hypothetical protein
MPEGCRLPPGRCRRPELAARGHVARADDPRRPEYRLVSLDPFDAVGIPRRVRHGIALSRADQAGRDQGGRRDGRQVPERAGWLEPSPRSAGAISREGCAKSRRSLHGGECQASGSEGRSRWILRNRAAGAPGPPHREPVGHQPGDPLEVKLRVNPQDNTTRTNALLRPRQPDLPCHATALALRTLFWDTLELYQIAFMERR